MNQPVPPAMPSLEAASVLAAAASTPRAGAVPVRAVHDAEWSDARAIAHALGARLEAAPLGAARLEAARIEVGRPIGRRGGDTAEVDIVPLHRALGRTLAHDLFATAAMPAFARSAMDGWVVGVDSSAGAGPVSWRLGSPILAGDRPGAEPVPAGVARPIATGAPVPPGPSAVLRSEHGDVLRAPGRGPRLHLNSFSGGRAPRVGDHVRPAGEEAAHGDPLLRAGCVIAAPQLALVAAAGFDSVAVRALEAVDVVLLGDELRLGGAPATGDGGVRDALGPALPGILARLGLGECRMRYAADDVDATIGALAAASARLIVTTGGSSRGPTDYVRAAITALGGRFVIDGVDVRPGHPVMIATLPGDRVVLCLPGNPLAALLCLAGLGVPLIDGLLGRPQRMLGHTVAATALPNPGSGSATRLVAGTTGEAGVTPVPWQGSGMLRGLAGADAVVVVPPGGVPAGAVVRALPLPW